MKKTLLSLFVAASFATVSAGEVTFDFTTNDYGLTKVDSNTKDDKDTPINEEYPNNGETITSDAVSITLDKLNGAGCRLWTATAGNTFRVNSGSGITISVDGGNITAITIDGGSKLNLLTTEVGTLDSGNTGSKFSWTGSEASVALVNGGEKGNTVQIKKLTVTYTDGAVDTRKEADLKFSEEKVTIHMGDEFTAPRLTKATTAAVTYASDKETVATVDAATGAVTIVGVGTARITASAEANTEFKAGSASYLITVKEAVPTDALYYSELGEDFTFEQLSGTVEPWQHDSKYGLKGSAFVNKTVNACEAIAASPVIDLAGYEGVTLQFQTAFNQYKINNEMIPVSDFDGYAFIMVKEEGGEWEEVEAPTAPEAFGWDFYANEPVDFSFCKGKKIQVGFKYVSTAECAGTWEVKGIALIGEKAGGIGEAQVEAAANGPVEYFNLQGVKVANPESGLYIRVSGDKVEKVML